MAPVAVKGGFGTGLLLTFAAAVIWGAQFPIAKDAFASVDALSLTAFRYGASVLMLAAFLAWSQGLAALSYEGRAGQAVLIGVVGMCGSPMLVFGGLMFCRPEVAAVIVATQPAMTALAEWFFTGKRPPRFTLFCVAVAFLGVFTVVTRWSLVLLPQGLELLGNAMVLAGAFAWVIYTMASARFKGWTVLRYTTLTMIPGTVATISITAGVLAMQWLPVPGLGNWAQVWPELIYLTVFGVLLSMVAWNAGTQRVGALNAMLFQNLMPVVAFLIAGFRGYPFAALELVGTGLVIGALVANNLYLRQVQRPERPAVSASAAASASASQPSSSSSH